MSDSGVIEIQVTAEERERLEALARRRGFDEVDAYLRALITSDVERHADEPPFDAHQALLEDFRQSWHEAMTANTRPLAELWDRLE